MGMERRMAKVIERMAEHRHLKSGEDQGTDGDIISN